MAVGVGVAVGLFNQLALGGGIPFETDLAQWIKKDSLSGSTLTDSLGIDSPTVLYPYLYRPTDTSYAYYTDTNNNLDILTGGFSVFGWIHVENKTTLGVHFGKSNSNATVGRYAIYTNDATGFVVFQVQTTTATFIVTSNVDASVGWHFVIGTVDIVGNKIHLYIDGVESGTGTAISGTFPTTTIPFMLGRTSVFTFKSKASYYNVGTIQRLLTTQERINALSGVFPSDVSALWSCSSLGMYDSSPNARHMSVVVGMSDAAIKYDATNGCKLGLNNGYSSFRREDIFITTGYQFDYFATEVPFHIPYLSINTPIVTPSGCVKLNDINGSSTNHNLADSELEFAGAFWDRSNTTTWSDKARGFYYDSLYPKRFHVSELNIEKLDYSPNADYINRVFPKISINSYNRRLQLQELLQYASKKSGSDLSRVLNYTKDIGKDFYRPVNGAGVCLNFDDTVRSTSWKAADDILFPLFGWKATFYLNGAIDGTNLINVQALMASGHEIANHSVHHGDWVAYLETHTVEELFNYDIAPQQTYIQNTLGITPVTFGIYYRAIHNQELVDYVLSHGFSHYRDAFVDPDWENSCIYKGNGGNAYNTILGDAIPNGIDGDNLMISMLRRANEENKVVIITFHTVGTTNDVSNLTVSQARLTKLCQYVADNNMKFYTMNELNDNIFGL